jgi:hypothetical protein
LFFFINNIKIHSFTSLTGVGALQGNFVIGQQSGFLKNMPKDKLMALFTNQLSRQHIDDMTKLWLVTALMNLVQSNVLETDVLEEPIIKLIKLENSLLLQEVNLLYLIGFPTMKP